MWSGIPGITYATIDCGDGAKTSTLQGHLSGNLIEYRKRLLVKIGPQRLECLEGDHPAKHYSIEELVALTKHYREEKRKAEKARGMQC